MACGRPTQRERHCAEIGTPGKDQNALSSPKKSAPLGHDSRLPSRSVPWAPPVLTDVFYSLSMWNKNVAAIRRRAARLLR